MGGGGGGEEVDFKIRLSPRTLLSLAYFYHCYGTCYLQDPIKK